MKGKGKATFLPSNYPFLHQADAVCLVHVLIWSILCREEGEKFNVWQACLNLEMQYGDPPEEAVMKLFQRALSYTDQKKLYMALVTLLERSSQVHS